MNKKIVVSVPLVVVIGKKKHYLNLNKYRNNHFRLNSNMKKIYSTIVKYKLLQYKNKNFKKISLEFTYYKPTKAKRDRSNILCIVEKYFCDAMVEIGMIYDDNDDHIESTFYKSGGIDRINPRVDVAITLL